MPDLGGLPALPDTAAADASTLGISPLLIATGCEEDGKGDLFSCCTLQFKHYLLSGAVQRVEVHAHLYMHWVGYKWQECTRKGATHNAEEFQLLLSSMPWAAPKPRMADPSCAFAAPSIIFWTV